VKPVLKRDKADHFIKNAVNRIGRERVPVAGNIQGKGSIETLETLESSGRRFRLYFKAFGYPVIEFELDILIGRTELKYVQNLSIRDVVVADAPDSIPPM
jgi:hypothetical protein